MYMGGSFSTFCQHISCAVAHTTKVIADLCSPQVSSLPETAPADRAGPPGGTTTKAAHRSAASTRGLGSLCRAMLASSSRSPTRPAARGAEGASEHTCPSIHTLPVPPWSSARLLRPSFSALRADSGPFVLLDVLPEQASGATRPTRLPVNRVGLARQHVANCGASPSVHSLGTPASDGAALGSQGPCGSVR